MFLALAKKVHSIEDSGHVKFLCFKVPSLLYLWIILVLDAGTILWATAGFTPQATPESNVACVVFAILYLILGECLIRHKKSTNFLYCYGILRSLLGVLVILFGLIFAVLLGWFIPFLIYGVLAILFGAAVVYTAGLWIYALSTLGENPSEGAATVGVPFIMV
eukprot:TRINITY_DN4091_c0_g1_i8.p1 TRINITY_DN4091_c0_g1~~TRINITY_DN4091_c0_g1_i8.p1  ORF type:complete len:163 (+),score=11.76 TRINITY_DN4091_c0_g1_i8:109-597(+)